MTTPFEISDDFTERWADLSPITATSMGIAGRDHLCTDFSPDGAARRMDLYLETAERLRPHLSDDEGDQAFAAKVLDGWLEQAIESHEDGKWARHLNHIHSPFQWIRDVFDVMPRTTRADWARIEARLAGFGEMLDGYQRSLAVGVDRGDTAALRQVESVLEQVEEAAGDGSRFDRLPRQAHSVGVEADPISSAVDHAKTACAGFADWLRAVYLPAARPEDAVGEERYLEGADEFLGMRLDPHETYLWGWDEIHRIRAEMVETAQTVDPDKNVEEVIDLLESDPDRSAATREEFVAFISDIQDRAIEKLAGDHFDVPDELKTVTVNIAPPGGSLGAWYVGPSEDFRRPGSIWYAPGQRERLPYWQEVSTAYHEGFPGHHLQVGTAVMQRERLSRFHRSVIWYPGSGEGWALYAERLMDELGFFEKPEYRLGLLASQLFRSVRIVVDIGCHLQKRLPDDAPLHGGETWSYEVAVDYMNLIGHQARDVAESEVKRYLGWWGQAISYKVGEREILDIRDQVSSSSGPEFDQADFHRRLLEAGAIRLDHLRDELT
jgi:uncharacterized protein (DUF885 family)